MTNRRCWKPIACLHIVKQREDESLKTYPAQFNFERMCIDDQDEKIKLEALLGGIWPQNAFMIELARKTPTTFCEL